MLKLIYCTILLSIINFSFLYSQSPEINIIKDILTNANNYRYGNVYLHKMIKANDIKNYYKKYDEIYKNSDTSNVNEILNSLNQDVKDFIKKNSDAKDASTLVERDEENKLRGISESMIETILTALKNANKRRDYNVFVVTNKLQSINSVPNEDDIIAMIIYIEETAVEKPMIDMLNSIKKEYVIVNEELKLQLDDRLASILNRNRDKSLMSYLIDEFIQGNFENVSIELKGIGSEILWAGKEYGKTNPLVKYDANYKISDKVLQQYKKITDGNPVSIGSMTNEVVISPDLIKWTNYDNVYQVDEFSEDKKVIYDSEGQPIINKFESSNNNLPNFGMELKYGVEGLYYNSFWSERLSLNAIWKSMKLGVILPTNGWSSLSSDLYNQDRRFTNSSSIGLGGKIDFPFYLIKMSDVWEFNFGYVFGDANQSTLHNRPELNEFKNDIIGFQNRQKDYLLRGNAQLHYSFAMNIDEDYLLRFGLGGTFYSVESWVNTVQIDSTNRTPKETLGYAKSETESIGGVSGRMDFMSKGNATPYGFSMMYFDETLGLNAWLQIPVIENIFALRLEANGYAVAFKSKERDWENSSIFTPMLRVVYNF